MDSEEGLSAKEGLLLWCQRKTAGYKGVQVENFTTRYDLGNRVLMTVGPMDLLCTLKRLLQAYSSCALIDRYRPDLLQYGTLQRHNHRRNFELAFAAAEKIEIAVPAPTTTSNLTIVPPRHRRYL